MARRRSRDTAMVAVTHLLIAPMLHLARGHSLRESGLFSFPSLSTDLVLAIATLDLKRIRFAVPRPIIVHEPGLGIPHAPMPFPTILWNRSSACTGEMPVSVAIHQARTARKAPAKN